MIDPTARFSRKVENYVQYRPGYPPAVLELLKTDCGLAAHSVIADVGSGTGLLAALFLKNGNRVFGVEPNREMREAGERRLAHCSNFTSVAATAEATTLPGHSVDFVTAGQAFHWFDAKQAKAEFRRILKPGGWVALVWNTRRQERSAFLGDYEALLMQYGTDYETVAAKETGEDVISAFFYPDDFQRKTFENVQVFDFEGLKGRLLSASYAPEPGHSSYEPMIQELRAVFSAHNVNGKVTFEYEPEVYYGHLSPAGSSALDDGTPGL